MFQLIFHLGSSGKRWQMDTISHRLTNPTSLAFQAPQTHGCALLIILQHLGEQVCVCVCVCACVQLLSHVWLFGTLWTVACQAPLSLGFSRQEYWSGLPCPSPGDLSDAEIKPASLWLLHCRRILYHWANREAKWMLKNLNKVRTWLTEVSCVSGLWTWAEKSWKKDKETNYILHGSP